MDKSVLNHPLRSHPGHPPPPGLALHAAVLPPDDLMRPLRLSFLVQGDPAVLRWPGPLAPATARRCDGLWRHTCFEAFVALPRPGMPAPVAPPAAAAGGVAEPAGTASAATGFTPYIEFNFSPSGAWAAYRFDGYRDGMRNEPLACEPQITLEEADGGRRLEVSTALPVAGVGVRLGLTAVLEATDGSLSYWALRHPPGRADFHNAAGFQLELEV